MTVVPEALHSAIMDDTEPLQPRGVKLCEGCGLPLPEGSRIDRRFHDATCRNRPRVAERDAKLAAERAARRAERQAELGTRICAYAPCEVDISDRDPRAVTCSETHRVYLTRQRARERAEREARS